jgi:hypothetical protein
MQLPSCPAAAFAYFYLAYLLMPLLFGFKGLSYQQITHDTRKTLVILLCVTTGRVKMMNYLCDL